MTIESIKQHVNAGNLVIWSNPGYEVQKDMHGQFNIIFLANGYTTGLTYKDGKTLNGNPSEFTIVPKPMNNFILISQTYADTTPESVACGDFSDTGFIDKCKEVTFEQLIDLMREHQHPSSSPNDGNIKVWYSTDSFVTDYRTGTNRETSIHFHRNNTPNAVKYWKWARKFADKK